MDIIGYLPRFSPELPKSARERILNDRLNAILTRLVLVGEVDPLPVYQKSVGKTLTVSKLYGVGVYQDLLRSMVLQYEALIDKNDAKQVIEIVDRLIERFGISQGAVPAVVRSGLERQLLRITQPLKPLATLSLNGVSPHNPKYKTLSAQFRAQGVHGSSVFFSAE